MQSNKWDREKTFEDTHLWEYAIPSQFQKTNSYPCKASEMQTYFNKITEVKPEPIEDDSGR